MKRPVVQTIVTLLLLLLLEHNTAKTLTRREYNGVRVQETPILGNDDLLKETAAAKGMDPSAIDELLRTNDTVVRNFTDNEGFKHTTSYTRTPEGGIMRNSFKERTSSIPLNDLLKSDGNIHGFGPIPTEEILKSDRPISNSYVDSHGDTIRTTFSLQKQPIEMPSWSNWSTAYSKPEVSESLTFTPHAINKDVEVFEPRKTTTFTPSSVFDNPSYWPTRTFGFNNGRPEPDIFTKQTTTKDDNGNTVTTNWTKKTFTFPSIPRLTPSTPSLFDSFYPTSTTNTPTTSYRPTKTFSVDDLPVTEILKNGKPADTDFIQKLPESLRPVTQTELTSTKTTSINNIPMTSIDDFQQNPELQDALQKAGITPDEIRASNGEPIVKTRVEPDGKIVRTTYRVNTIPTNTYGSVPSFDNFKPSTFPRHHFGNDFNLDDDKWLLNRSPSPTTTTAKPQVNNEIIDVPVRWQWKLVPEITPTVREQLEKSGISNNEIQESYNKPIVKTRFDETGKLVSTTYNLRDFTREPSKISDFLLRVDQHPDDILLRSSHGITKTIIEDDGRILTANFRLSLPLNGKSDKTSGNK